MKIVEVIPVVRGLGKETLSYFTKEDFSPGTFVRIPLKNQEVVGIVLSAKDARSLKAALKGAAFQLKKLSKVESAGQLPFGFIEAAEKTALYYASTLGNMLAALIPKIILESPDLLPQKISKPELTSREPLLIQLSDVERAREYKGLVRERFARGESVLFCAPTHEDVLRAEDILSKGIEQYVFTTSRKTPKRLRETILNAQQETHPILFITTPSYLFFDRPDLTTIIVERENSRSYHTMRRPYFRWKTFIEYYTAASGKTLIMGDSVLSLETLHAEKEGKYVEFSPLTWRSKKIAPMRIVDMRRKSSLTDPDTEIGFRIFSKQMMLILAKAIEEKKKVFLFGVRRGLSPSTVCGHCGSLLLCKNCNAPVILHAVKNTTAAGGDRIYLCHHCGVQRDPLTTCDNCGSWKLIPIGIGIDRIREEVERLFPEAPVFVLDRDHAPTRSVAIATIKSFAEEKGGILIGTELALLYLEKVPFTAVVSLDSLFSIPDFGINERVFYLLTHLHGIAETEMLIQTRNGNEPVLAHAQAGNVLDFYRGEILEREELFYPPFSLFIKVSVEGTFETVRETATKLSTLFNDWKPDFIENRGQRPGAKVLSMILRVKRGSWPEKALADKLLLLPPEFLIKVDPESIL